MKKRVEGFSIVSVVFLLVILALIATYIINIGVLTRMSSTYAIQGQRAYFATKSGLEWIVFQVTNGAGPYNCPAGSIPPSSITISPLQQGLSNFQVVVTCSQITYNEGGNSFNLFFVTAQGTYGTLGKPDYYSRQIVATVTQPGA